MKVHRFVAQTELKAVCMDMRTHHQNRDPTVVAQCQWCTVYNVSGVVVVSGVANVIIKEIVLKQCYLNSFRPPSLQIK